MKKFFLLFLVAIAGGIGGGTLVWLAVKPAPVAPIVTEAQPDKEGAASTAAPIAETPERGERSSSIAQATSIATTNVTIAGPVQVRPESADDPDRALPSSAERNVRQAPSVFGNGVVVARAVGAAPGNPSPTSPPPAPAAVSSETIDLALSYALEAAEPYVKEGFTVREDYWGGVILADHPKAIVHQLFKGNEYWFWMGTPLQGAKINVHVFDTDGNKVEVEHWQKPHMAAARVIPKKTAGYYLIVGTDRAPASAATGSWPWGMVYGFR